MYYNFVVIELMSYNLQLSYLKCASSNLISSGFIFNWITHLDGGIYANRRNNDYNNLLAEFKKITDIILAAVPKL